MTEELHEVPVPDDRTAWLVRFEPWLRLLARLEIDSRFAGKFSASDAVQQTMFEAWRGWEAFRGCGEPERAAWLRGILIRQLAGRLRSATWRVLAAAWIMSAAYGARDEVHQLFVPGREGDAAGFAADALGALAAAGAIPAWGIISRGSV